MRRLSVSKLLLLLINLLLLSVFPALAQDDTPATTVQPDEPPTFALAPLTDSFLPDPWMATVMVNGNLDASTLELGDDCTGFIAAPPDVELEFVDDNMEMVRVFFVSEDDTTLIIRDPDGDYMCNDNGELNGQPLPIAPLMEFEPVAGAYDIWVGAVESDTSASGYLMLTQEPGTFPGHIVSPLLGEVIDPDDMGRQAFLTP